MALRNRFARPVQLLAAFALLAAFPFVGMGQDGSGEGVLVRVNADVALDADAREAVVVVVNGDAEIAGAAEFVLVVNGTATLAGARVTQLVVVEGEANLQAGAVVAGDVQLVNAGLTRSEDAVVQGEVFHDTGYRFGRGLLIFGLIFGFGIVVAVMVSGLIAAAVAPRAVRAAGAALTGTLGKTFMATLVVWVGLPLVAGVAFATVVGIPTGLGILFVLLPALGYLGYLIAGIRLGDYVLGRVRGNDEAWHPYRAAVVGLSILLVAGWIPIVGSVVTPVAAFLGAGALALHAWQTARRPRAAAPVEEIGVAGWSSGF